MILGALAIASVIDRRGAVAVRRRMAIDIDEWLQALGMERYVAVFKEHDVTGEVLPLITAEDLKDMGIVSVGHRRQLLSAIARLRSAYAQGKEATPPARLKTYELNAAKQERRQLSVVFTDLVGSTQLSEQLDAEELSALLSSYKSVVTEIVEDYGGFVAQYLGDGVLAYFGWPQAYEHDAERAIRSGLRITESMHALGKPQGVEVNCRIGIATGRVVVGDLIRNSYIEEDQAVGRAPNLAARIQMMAKPGTLAISDETRKIVGDKFELVDLGNHKLKGFKGELRIWRVEGAAESSFSEGKLPLSDSLPIINRTAELAHFKDTWKEVENGHTQSMIVSGEPGIGKSRLAEEFTSAAVARGGKILRFHCSPFHTNDALFPVLSHIWTRVLASNDRKTGNEIDLLEHVFRSTNLEQNKTAALIEALAEFRENSGDREVTLDALGRKEMTFQALISLFEWFVADEKVLIVFEDLHWVDPTTKELLGRLVESVKSQQVMMLFTCRSMFQTTWEANDRVERIELTRLKNTEIGDIAAHVYGMQPVPVPILELIAERSDGVPLFAEELSKSFIESGVFDGNAGASLTIEKTSIPTALNDLLVARLDRHPESRRILQTAAAIGRDFSLEVLSAVIEEANSVLKSHLDTLISAQIIVAKTDAPGAYSFRHALMRDAAYETMLRSVCSMVHTRIAAVLSSTFRTVTPAHVLGSHWALSGNHAAATRCFCQAADLAQSRYANTEAKVYYEMALAQLEKADLTEGTHAGVLPSRVDILENLGKVLTLVHDLEDAVAAFGEAIKISVGDPLRIARLHRLTGNALQQDRAGSLAELAVAESILDKTTWRDDPELLCEWIDVQLNKLNVHYWSGDGDAMSALAASLATYLDQMTPEQQAEYYDQLVLRDLRMSRYDPSDETLKTAENYVSAAIETSNLAIIASAQFILGFVNLHSMRLLEAGTAMHAGLEAARQSGHRKIELRCMAYLATVYRRMNKAADSLKFSRESSTLAMELHMDEYDALATSNLAWEAWQRNSVEEAHSYAKDALARFEKTSIAYPFEWYAILPLIAASQSNADLSGVPKLCTRMLDPSQQVLPEPLRLKANELATTTSAIDTDQIRQGIVDLLAAARGLSFL